MTSSTRKRKIKSICLVERMARVFLNQSHRHIVKKSKTNETPDYFHLWNKKHQRQKNPSDTHPEFILDTLEVVFLGLQISQGEVERLTRVIFARIRSLDVKNCTILTANEYALWSLETR